MGSSSYSSAGSRAPVIMGARCLARRIVSRCNGFVAAICALLLLASLPLFAQQENAGAPATGPSTGRQTAPPRETDLTVSISKVNGQPGKEVNVPVMFSRKEG